MTREYNIVDQVDLLLCCKDFVGLAQLLVLHLQLINLLRLDFFKVLQGKMVQAVRPRHPLQPFLVAEVLLEV